MAGWWDELKLRGLLERHREELATVWPAVRDGAVPPVPQGAQVVSLHALFRTAGRMATGRGDGTGISPRLAPSLLSLVLLHPLAPAATPDWLRPYVDQSADVGPDIAEEAGSLSARFLAHAASPQTPDTLRRWCVDASLLCATCCVRGAPPPRHAAARELLARAAGQRFKDLGDPADEDAAITHARTALDTTRPEEDASGRVRRSAHLAELLTTRASRRRDSSDIGDAPALARAALAAVDPASPQWLYHAARAMSTFITATAQDKHDVELVDEALELQGRMRRHPLYHLIRDKERPSYAGLLAQRFARRRDPEILAEAIAAYEELYAEEPATYAADLGRHLQYRYQMSGDTADRHRALELMAEGLAGPDTPREAVTSFGAATLHEHRESGDPAVVTRALAVVRRLTAPGAAHAEDSGAHGALADLLIVDGENAATPDYGPAEEAARRSLALARDAGDRATAFARIAGVLVHRYQTGHDLARLDEAAACCREGRAGLPDDAEVPVQLFGSLVMVLAERHSRTRHLAALREAVEAAEHVARDTPEFGAEFPLILSNLVTLLVEYATRTGRAAELDRGRRLVEDALATTAPGHYWRSRLTGTLGTLLLARSQLPGAAPDDAGTAVHLYETALREAPDDPRQRLVLYGGLATALRERHRRGGDRADLDRALEIARDALHRVPPGAPQRGGFLGVLTKTLNDIARADRGYGALYDEAVDANAELAADPAQPTAARVAAAVQLAGVAHLAGDEERALEAVRGAVEMLPLLVWRGVDRSDQEQMLGSMARAGSFAAEIALAAGRPEEALELLEAGRGVLAAQALELRTETEELAAAAPDLAARLTGLRAELDRTADVLTGADADRRHRLAREWQETLDAIRARDGFHDFLRPLRAERLLPAGESGPVVVVTVGMGRGGHALLLDGSGLTVCPLPGLTDQDARERSEVLLSAAAAAGRSGLARAFAERAVGDVLDWLWRTVAEPVLDALGITGPPPPGEAPPRLWWCPSGALSFLPLHAAGAVPDRVVSSYTPGLTALLRARAGSAAPGRDPLIVAVPEPDGQAPLPGALHEAEAAHRALGGTLLRGTDADAVAVRAALGAHSWAHFACHGVQDPEQPSQGRLLLTGGTLTVREVTRLHLPGAEFAYLSACETAVGGSRLPDEALHLAGSLQLAGFSQVIGTLWRVDDESSAEIAEQVYRRLTEAAPGAPPAARALHRATLRLRERNPDRPLSWAAHVHSGA